jgi:signal transduction histidine kinase
MDKLWHILSNLIGNAVKFTEKGKVDVSVKENDSQAQIIVADTGIGIDEKHLPYIFDEFRQADGSTSRRYGGTGLGLAIAKKYAEMLGGSVHVESIPDSGSVFTLTLPLVFKDESGASDDEPAISFRRLNLKTLAESDSISSQKRSFWSKTVKLP